MKKIICFIFFIFIIAGIIPLKKVYAGACQIPNLEASGQFYQCGQYTFEKNSFEWADTVLLNNFEIFFSDKTVIERNGFYWWPASSTLYVFSWEGEYKRSVTIDSEQYIGGSPDIFRRSGITDSRVIAPKPIYDPEVAYVTKCYGYEKYFENARDQYCKVDIGIDLSNNNFDRVVTEFYVSFPTSDMVLALEDNGFTYTKTLPKQVYNFLTSSAADKYYAGEWEIYDSSSVYSVSGSTSYGKFFSTIGTTSSLTLRCDWLDIIPLEEHEKYSVWNTNDMRYWGWFKHFQEVAYFSQLRITCYKDDIPGYTTIIKLNEIGSERYQQNYNPVKSIVTPNVAPDQVDVTSDEYLEKENQSASQIEQQYQQDQQRQEIIDQQIADAAGVSSIAGSLKGIVSAVPQMTNGIRSAVAALFAPLNYLPGEIRGIFLATIIILCAIAIIKFIRG